MSSIMNVFAVWMVAGAAIGNPNVPDTSTAKSLAKSMVPKQTASGGAVRRDKSWTSAGRKNAHSSQVQPELALTSCISFVAEGTGFEPATGFPASDFESIKCRCLAFG